MSEAAPMATARSVPDIRLECMRRLREPRTFRTNFDEQIARQMYGAFWWKLTDSPLWYIGPEPMELVEAAAAELPPWAEVESCLPPTDTGFVVVANGRESPCALQWLTMPLPNEPTAVTITIYDSEDSWRNSSILSFEDEPEDQREERPPEYQVIRNRVLALFALMRSPGILRTEEVQADRAARRRAERAGVDLDATRVIYLNGHDHIADGTAEGHDYRHRWIVSGHWRSQPYGPASSLRRPVWIAPHIKGPEGAPLLTGDKVRAITRGPEQ
jgi:hypothetical protein